jgi:hypothetical protein
MLSAASMYVLCSDKGVAGAKDVGEEKEVEVGERESSLGM